MCVSDSSRYSRNGKAAWETDAFLLTERLALRAFTGDEAEVDALVALDADPEVMRFLTGGKPTPREEVVSRQLPRLLHRYPCTGLPGFWAALGRERGDFLGWFELRPLAEESAAVLELGYRLRRSVWGGGLATEGSRALVRAAFTRLGTERVTANTMAVNAASRRVMEKAGLSFVRQYTEDWPEPIPGSEHGEVEYAVTREEWLRRAGAGARP